MNPFSIRIFDYGHGNLKHNLGVTVYENPDAWIFKGETKSTLTVWVWGACGYAELYVKHLQKLLEAYRKQMDLPS